MHSTFVWSKSVFHYFHLLLCTDFATMHIWCIPGNFCSSDWYKKRWKFCCIALYVVWLCVVALRLLVILLFGFGQSWSIACEDTRFAQSDFRAYFPSACGFLLVSCSWTSGDGSLPKILVVSRSEGRSKDKRVVIFFLPSRFCLLNSPGR